MSLSYKVNLLAEIITITIITLIITLMTPRYESCLSHQVGQEL